MLKEMVMTEKLLVNGATVIDTFTGMKEIRDILIEGERIAGMGAVGSLDVPDGAKKISARECYAIPGLWDTHIHLTTWPEVENRLPELLIAYGITSVRDMGAPLEKILAFRKKAMQKQAVAPRIWFAGPFINSSPAWGNAKSAEVDTPEQAITLIDSLVEAGIHFVKAYEMLLPEVFRAIVKQAEKHGLKVAGHIPMSMTIPEILAISPHYDIQHLGGQCTGMKFECSCHAQQLHDERVASLEINRVTAETGVALMMAVENSVPVLLSEQDPAKRADLIKLFIEKGTWHTPTLTAITSLVDLGYEEHSDRIKAFKYLPKVFVDQWRKILADMKDALEPRYKWGPWFMETVGLMHEAGVQFLAGTDCPPNPEYTPGLALHLELHALVQAGLTPLAALQSATLNPAKFFEIESDLGSIAEGKLADMILLAKDPLEDINNTRQIVAVISRGRYFSRETLDNIFASLIEKDG